MAIHLELEYAKRFEKDGAQASDGGGEEEGADGQQSPLPPKADVSWAHILAQNQVCACNDVSWSAVYITEREKERLDVHDVVARDVC